MNNNKLDNYAQSFIFTEFHVNGCIVKLNDSYKEIIKLQNISGPAAQLLGETLVAATMLAQPIKTESSVTIQFQSEGDIKLLAVTTTTDGKIRATINCKKQPESALLGEGHLVVTIQEQNNPKPHQSVINVLKGQTISEALTEYFAQSVQMPSIFYFNCTEDNACGIMMQQAQELVDKEQWNTLFHLFKTITGKELIELDSANVIHRLFHEFDIKLFPEKEIEFKCSCSLQKMKAAVSSIGEQEALDILKSKKVIEVLCEYCKNNYSFNKDDITNIFTKH